MIFVSLGGFFGAIARYYLSNQISQRYHQDFPFATFSVNLIGCFFIGIILNYDISSSVHLLVTIGFLGAFTTFSTFAVEIVQLIEKKKFVVAAIYIISSGICGIGCTIIGLTIF